MEEAHASGLRSILSKYPHVHKFLDDDFIKTECETSLKCYILERLGNKESSPQMSLRNHRLLKATRANVAGWMSSEEMQLTSLRLRLGDDSLSPLERYEVGCFSWCKTLTQIFTRLRTIREMTNRSIYKKKGEDKSKVTRDWMSHNYQLYSVVYQSILDVALLVTNEILDLGYTDRQCSYDTICHNRRVKAWEMLGPSKELQKSTLKHREGKNLLVHQGRRIPLPAKRKKITSRPELAQAVVG